VNLPTRDNLLRATARGWLDKVIADLPVLELDAQLQTAVLQDQQLDQLLGQLSATDRLESAVRTLAYLSMFPEGRFGEAADEPDGVMRLPRFVAEERVLKWGNSCVRCNVIFLLILPSVSSPKSVNSRDTDDDVLIGDKVS
jgi:hypothetical protein